MNSPTPSFSFAQALISWQLADGRHDLPWQNTTDAYKIWLSEIMLQQTQVVTVKTYYDAFLKRFPDVTSLAKASQDEVLSLWTGLGYYSRARNLHACAKAIVADFNGKFPSTPEQLVMLKGIGPSTAAAIAVFANGYPAAILDGNVKRIITRLLGITEPPSGATERVLWQHAEALLASKRDAKVLKISHADALRAYTQGLMDLGATVCTRNKPRCELCPMQTNCYASIHYMTDKIPAPKMRPSSPEIDVHLFIYAHNGKIWLEKRPESGIWAGLYSFPERQRLQTLAGTVSLPVHKHVLTHRVLKLHPYLIQLNTRAAHALEDVDEARNGAWFGGEVLTDVGLPKPIVKLIKRVLALS